MIVKTWSILHLAVMIILVAYMKRLSDNLENQSRRYVLYAMTSVFFWVFSDFILVNTSSVVIASLVVSLRMISISLIFGFFFLSCLSFTHKCSFKCKLVASTPLIVFLAILGVSTKVAIQTSIGFQVRPNPAYLLWMLIGDSLVLVGVMEMLRVKASITSKVLKKKITYFIIPVTLAVIIGSFLTVMTHSTASALITPIILLFTWLAFKSPEKKERNKNKGN